MNKRKRSVSQPSKSGTNTKNVQTEAPRSKLRFWLRLLGDILVAAIILGVLYLFLEILPQYQQYQRMKEMMAASAEVETETAAPAKPEVLSLADDAQEPAATEAPAETAAPEQADAAAPEAVSAPEAEEALDGEDEVELTLKEKFAEYFSDEVVKEKMSYTSPDISVQITKVKDATHGSKEFIAYVADIHVTSVENLRAAFPNAGKTATADRIVAANNGIFGVNGDYYLNIRKGFIVRNGMVLKSDEGTSDICVLYSDGVMSTYEPGTYSAEVILNQNPWQVWSFGPALLDDEGLPKTEFNISATIAGRNPRTAIGYYEPGHYCMVVIDGRMMSDSYGASMQTLASFMSDLGCTVAYNLDGGASSSMVFNGRTISNPSGGGRVVSDVVMLWELPRKPEPEPEPEPTPEAKTEPEPTAAPETKTETEPTATPETAPEVKGEGKTQNEKD